MDDHIVAPRCALFLRVAETTIRSPLPREEPRYIQSNNSPDPKMTACYGSGNVGLLILEHEGYTCPVTWLRDVAGFGPGDKGPRVRLEAAHKPPFHSVIHRCVERCVPRSPTS